MMVLVQHAAVMLYHSTTASLTQSVTAVVARKTKAPFP